MVFGVYLTWTTVLGSPTMKRHALALLAFSAALFGQRLDPVQWTLSSDATKIGPGARVPLRLTAKMQAGWHLYSLTTPMGGPIPTSAVMSENAAIEKWVLFQPKPERKFDPNFNLDTETFGEEAVFLVSAHVKPDAPAGELNLTAEVRYQACSDRQCLPPRKKTAPLTLDVAKDAPAAVALVVPAGYTQVGPGGALTPEIGRAHV